MVLPQVMLRILAVDDEPVILRVLERLLRGKGHAVTTADSGEATLAIMSGPGAARPDVILLDVQMSGIDGLETLTRLHQIAPAVPVIIMTGQTDVEVAVRAFRRGAVDFVVKPFVDAKLFMALNAVAGALREAAASEETGKPQAARALVGESPAFRAALDLAVKLARPDINILLAGETGTGKELFARAIHAASKRKSGPFVAVDCSMLAENLIESELFGHEKGAFTGAVATRIGYFERADGGTLFLDEVGNLSVNVQAKLLRVLQERTLSRVGSRDTKQLDVRLVSAANVDLLAAVDRGAFRMDLYYRLAEAVICPPPLRDREGDVKRLAEHFVERYAARFEVPARAISPEALARLEAHAWPGNVRELEAVVKVAVVLAGDVVLPEHLPRLGSEPGHDGAASTPRPRAPSDPTLEAPSASTPRLEPGGDRFRFEVEFGADGEGMDLKALTSAAGEKAERVVLEAMLQRGLSQAQLARLVNVDPKTLRGKLRKYGLDAGST